MALNEVVSKELSWYSKHGSWGPQEKKIMGLLLEEGLLVKYLTKPIPDK